MDEFGHVDVNLETKTTPKKVIKKRNNANGVKEEKTKIKCKDEVVKVTNDTQVVSSIFVISTDLAFLTSHTGVPLLATLLHMVHSHPSST